MYGSGGFGGRRGRRKGRKGTVVIVGEVVRWYLDDVVTKATRCLYSLCTLWWLRRSRDRSCSANIYTYNIHISYHTIQLNCNRAHPMTLLQPVYCTVEADQILKPLPRRLCNITLPSPCSLADILSGGLSHTEGRDVRHRCILRTDMICTHAIPAYGRNSDTVYCILHELCVCVCVPHIIYLVDRVYPTLNPYSILNVILTVHTLTTHYWQSSYILCLFLFPIYSLYTLQLYPPFIS